MTWAGGTTASRANTTWPTPTSAGRPLRQAQGPGPGLAAGRPPQARQRRRHAPGAHPDHPWQGRPARSHGRLTDKRPVAGEELLPLRPRHFALDALDSYKTAPDNPGRMVPNPAKEAAKAAATSAKKAVERAEATRDARLAELKDLPRHHCRDHEQDPRPARRPPSKPPPSRRTRPGGPREDPARPAQPGHGAPGRRDRAHHARDPDGCVQRRGDASPGPAPASATKPPPRSARL